jgi:hypothetical protein
LRGGVNVEEEWEVKVDAGNTTYLESSAGAIANLFSTDRMFYVTDFRGNRRSALYYFYLSSVQVPLGFHDGLYWDDVLPLGKVYDGAPRFMSELLLLFGSQIRATESFEFGEVAQEGGNLIIRSKLSIIGRGLFAGIQRENRGELKLSREGEIESFEFHSGSTIIFQARKID